MPNTQTKPIIEFRSEQVQEIVSAIPSWLIGLNPTFFVLLISCEMNVKPTNTNLNFIQNQSYFYMFHQVENDKMELV